MKFKKYSCYADGGCNPNTGDGSCGIFIELSENGQTKVILEKSINILGSLEKPITNQVAELTSVIRTLDFLSTIPDINSDAVEINIFSDSAYIINCFKNNWFLNWFRSSWKNSANGPVANKELWIELFSKSRNVFLSFREKFGSRILEENFSTPEIHEIIKSSSKSIRINFLKIKGHNGIYGNERADELATIGKNNRNPDEIVKEEKPLQIKHNLLKAFDVVFKNNFLLEEKIKILSLLENNTLPEEVELELNHWVMIPEFDSHISLQKILYSYIKEIASLVD